jgi:hypothetical protein
MYRTLTLNNQFVSNRTINLFNRFTIIYTRNCKTIIINVKYITVNNIFKSCAQNKIQFSMGKYNARLITHILQHQEQYN